MSENEPRNTQFLGFATLLWQDLLNAFDQMDTDMDVVDGCSLCSLPQAKVAAVLEPIIAKRAYDFLVSSHYHTAMLATWEESRERVALVPDLTAWPD